MIEFLLRIYGPLLMVVVVVVAAVVDARKTAVCVGVFALLVAPGRITHFAPDSLSGVAESAPEVTVFLVVTVVLALMSFRYPEARARLPLTFVGLAIYFVLAMTVLWNSDLRTWAGILQYLLAPVGWIAGVFLYHFARAGVRNATALVGSVLAALSIQVVATTVQLLGGGFNARAADSEITVEGRVNGTVGHPNTLGKMTFLALLILLPMTRHQNRNVSRMAIAGLCACFFLFAVTAGRANFIAAILAIAVWAILLPRNDRPLLRWIYWGVTGVAAVAAWLVLSGRFEQDPLGGSRDELTAAALRTLPDFLWSGMGPNNYLPTMQFVDPPSAAQGLPVHNSILMATAELGLPGVVLLLAPWMWLIVRSLRPCWQRPGSDWARVVVSSVAPLLVISLTGFGMIADNILPLWFMVLGMCDQGLRADTRSRDGAATVQEPATPRHGGRPAAARGSRKDGVAWTGVNQ